MGLGRRPTGPPSTYPHALNGGSGFVAIAAYGNIVARRAFDADSSIPVDDLGMSHGVLEIMRQAGLVSLGQNELLEWHAYTQPETVEFDSSRLVVSPISILDAAIFDSYSASHKSIWCLSWCTSIGTGASNSANLMGANLSLM